MAETTIGNWFDKVFFDAHGEPCAGGTLYFYQTGTDIPLGVTTAGGVLLGACVRLDDDGRPVEDFRFYADRSYRVVLKDADGAVVKQIDDVCIAQTEGGGMLNPMTALGDLIVGGEDGVPARLGVGTAGQVPTAQEDGSIAWEDTRGFGKVSAASGDASASYLDNKLDVTTPLAKEVTTGQHNIKRVKLSVSAGDTAGKVLTTTDNGLGVLVPTWQTPTGMENPMTAKADIIVGGASGAPDKLAAPANASFLRAYKNSSNEDVVNWSKLSAGANVTITDAGTQVTISADAQTGDHKVSTDGTDTAGYLEDKVAAGTGISVTKSSGQLVVAATGADTNEVKTSASDDHPGYLQSKVLAGDLIRVDKEQTPDGDGGYTENLRVNLDARGVTAGYVPTADGSNGAAWAAPAAQPGDHQLLVSATDAAAGYLGAKLTAGSNVTLTPQTDGDGAQTLEISATGGGVSASGLQVIVAPRMLMNANYTALDTGRLYKCACSIAFNKVTGFALMYSDAATKTPNVLDVGIYEGTKPADAVKISTFTRSAITINGFAWSKWVFDAPVTIDQSKTHWICVVTSQPTGASPGYIVGEYAGYTGYSSAVGVFGGYIDPASSCPNNLPTSGFGYGHFFPALTLYGEY